MSSKGEFIGEHWVAMVIIAAIVLLVMWWLWGTKPLTTASGYVFGGQSINNTRKPLSRT